MGETACSEDLLNARVDLQALTKTVPSNPRSRANVQIVFRGDSHHTKPEIMEWLEAHGVSFITGLSPNPVLNKLFALTIQEAEKK